MTSRHPDQERVVAQASSLPTAGSVLGIDVGFSPTRRSSAVCRLDWTEHHISWLIQRYRAHPAERLETILTVADDHRLEAAAFDGPLQPGFAIIGRYRTAEKMLTRRIGARIGKPGQSHAPVGKLLNTAANECVRTVFEHCDVAPARHAVAIDARAVAEAFPSAFLGLMLEHPGTIPTTRANRSDVYFQFLGMDGTLQRLSLHLLPERTLRTRFEDVTNHDDRAALICALTALCVAAGDFTAVGDAGGWIILPPHLFTAAWARADLQTNAQETGSFHHYHHSGTGMLNTSVGSA
jgi:hypothetical protein